MELKFRVLRADEIEARVARVTERGAAILLYKDARCDQTILDETVGALNWQRHHTRDNANCVVSIYDADKCAWVEKEDTGTRSNTEEEKGLASDSFKRACFNWGIGRELYTAPFIWFSAGECNAKGGKCYDHFDVTGIEYDDKRIASVTIRNRETKAVKVFRGDTRQIEPASNKDINVGAKAAKKREKPLVGGSAVSIAEIKSVKDLLEETNSDVRAFIQYVNDKTGGNISSVDEMNREQFDVATKMLTLKKNRG